MIESPSPTMRMILITVVLTLLPLVSQGATYGAGIENSRWNLLDSVFDCSLTQDIPGYGKAVFRHRAGESLTFYLESDGRLMRPGRGSLVVEAPAWRPGVAPRPVGTIEVAESNRPVSLDPRQTMVLISGLLEGMAPTLTRQAWYSRDMIRVRLSNINFARPFEGYRSCVASLLPANYDQVRRSRIGFASDSVALSDADRHLLDNIVAYVLADATVERIFVDGHSDRIGSRIHNRALSEDRANAVADYLVSQGVSRDRIIVRAHGDQYPVSRRPADNRRATIRLERQGDRPDMQRASNGADAESNG